MTDYNPIPDNILEPDDPIPADLGIRWRDNPIAMFEGAPGAPRLQLAALDAGFVTAGGIGSYVFAVRNTTGNIAYGSTVAGSTLTPTAAFTELLGGTTATASPVGSPLTGTWQCMGTHTYDVNNFRMATLWMRIA